MKKDVKETSKSPAEPVQITPNVGDFGSTISTGSTLLDLTISGGRTRKGGIPGGILLEIYGPSSSGKTAIISEMSASVQSQKGEIKFLDPEARLDQEYTKVYGVKLSEGKNYFMPETVSDVMEHIEKWEPADPKKMNMIGTDSIAALCSRMQMNDTDKTGQAAAKEFSQGLRKVCVQIRKSNWIIAFTNQIRHGQGGETTPGGFAVPFYASLRMRIGPPATDKYITKETTINGVKTKRILGVRSVVKITKSSIDDPFRMTDVNIVFGYGVDDVRGNLQFCKQYMEGNAFDCFDKTFRRIDVAIDHIESNNLQEDLKERTINLWHEVQDSLKVIRVLKKR